MTTPEYVIERTAGSAKLLQRSDEPRWTTTGEPMYPNEYRVIAEGNINDLRALMKKLDGLE